MRAYVEVKIDAGSNVRSILSAMKNIEGVRDASAVTGHTDIVVALEAQDLKGIADIVTQRIHAIRGVSNTETMVCVED